MFDHFLITRFNLKKEGWETSKNNIPVLTEAWLTNRFQLFETYCYASVKAQTLQNFTWLVYFDVSTPENFKKRIETLVETFKNFQPRFVDGMSQFLPSIQQEIAQSKKEYVITSRLDNDDCLSNNYIEEVQKRFQKRAHLALDFVDGYTLQINPDYRLGKRLHYFNPFISLIEENESPKSVWHQNHGDWKRDPNLKTISKCRTWMSIIHAENKVNDFAGFGKVQPTILDNFVHNTTALKAIKKNLIPFKKWRWQSFSNSFQSHEKVFSKKLKRSIRLAFTK